LVHQAARLQFGRVVDEFTHWRALAEKERPPAPAWWWGPAMEMREALSPLPPEWCAPFALADGATYAAAATVIFRALAGQTYQPWPYDFSRKIDSTDSDVRDLHVQPSDDSAFTA
jgi:hypothetical protein